MKQRLQLFTSRLEQVPAGWWVVLLVLPALAPLVQPGFFQSHDGIFHVYRLDALDRAVRAGVLYPRWFPEFAFGYGHPVLNFYGPVSYYWGLPFTLLGLDAVAAMKLVLATGLLASALAMYGFARLHVGRGPAVVAAAVYAYLPYHLLDLYVRGAVAEFLAFVWFPLVLLAFHQVVTGEDRRRWVFWVALAALTLVALVLTHSLSALVFAPVLGIYVLLLLGQRRSLASLGRVALAAVLAIALGAFYWLPVLLESGFVGLGSGTSQGYQRHFLSLGELLAFDWAYNYGARDPIAFPVGWLQVALIVAALPLPFLRRQRRWPALFFLAVALLSGLMLTGSSLPIWQLFEPGLAFLQYPWRFQALTVLATALLAGLLLQALANPRSRPAWIRWPAAILLLAATAAWALAALPYAPTSSKVSVERMWTEDRDLGQVGATWTGEYLPIWVQEQRWAISHPAPDQPASVMQGPPPRDLKLTGVGYTRYHLVLNAPHGASLVLHQFYYPGWQAHWQGRVIPAHPLGTLGLAAFDLPPGSGRLVLRLALTPAQLWGSLVSLLATLVVAVTLLTRLQLHRGLLSRADQGNRLAVVGFYLLLLSVLLGSIALPNGYQRAATPVNANLADIVQLQSFSLTDRRFSPGDTVEVTLYWMPLVALSEDYKTFIHLTDAEVTRQPTQHDDDPGGNFTPTTRWLPGELVPDTHSLRLPINLTPGLYHLWTDMYQYPSISNLAVLASDAPHDGKRVLLAEIEVVAR